MHPSFDPSRDWHAEQRLLQEQKENQRRLEAEANERRYREEEEQ
jgi:hypothetical protein